MNNKYNKEKLKKDLQFFLSNLKHHQHLQNLLVSTTEQAIRGLDGLIEDDSTLEEIKNSQGLNSDFQELIGYLTEVRNQNKLQERFIREIIKKFQEQLE